MYLANAGSENVDTDLLADMDEVDWPHDRDDDDDVVTGREAGPGVKTSGSQSCTTGDFCLLDERRCFSGAEESDEADGADDVAATGIVFITTALGAGTCTSSASPALRLDGIGLR